MHSELQLETYTGGVTHPRKLDGGAKNLWVPYLLRAVKWHRYL